MSVKDQNIIFRYMVRLTSGGIFCSTKDGVTGKTRMFLVFKDQEKIYSRDALRETWDELQDQEEYESIWDCFVNALQSGIPNFSSASLV